MPTAGRSEYTILLMQKFDISYAEFFFYTNESIIDKGFNFTILV